MDFYRIKERPQKNGVTEIYPDFKVCRSEDLMIRAKSFYAIWDPEVNLWSTDEYKVQDIIDKSLLEYKEGIDDRVGGSTYVKYASDFSSGVWLQFRNYMAHISDSAVQLDSKLTFSNTKVSKHDYVSRRLPYPLESGSIENYDLLISTLYDPSERSKLEWAIGSIIAGDSVDIQKFVVLYGAAGAGKSTVLNIIQSLFAGYYTTFEAKALGSNSNQFATEAFRGNPLVAIQHDGDLSRIEDNTKLNSIVSHEDMLINEKNKPTYTSRVNAFLFMGTNKPVKITDSKSGLLRRLIDVKPSGRRLKPIKYQTVMGQIQFELGAIAQHCLDVYREMGKDYYAGYQAIEMILETNVFYNFMESYFDLFKEQDGVSLNQAYSLYKTWCDDSMIEYKLPRHKFRDELREYFREFKDRHQIGEDRIRSWYDG